MIDQETFTEFFTNLLAGTIQEIEMALQAGEDVGIPNPAAIAEELFKVTRPTVEHEKINLSDFSEQIRDWWVVDPKYAYLHLFYDTGKPPGEQFLTSYIDGASSKDGPPPTDNFTLDINDVVSNILVERGLLDEDNVTKYMPPSVKRLAEKQGHVRNAFQQQVQEEVESFREEMNSALDELFGGG